MKKDKHVLKKLNSHSLDREKVSEIIQYINTKTLPGRVLALHLSSRYRYINNYKGWFVKDGKLFDSLKREIVPREEIEGVLKKMYEDPKHSRKNVDVFYANVNRYFGNITKADVGIFLNFQVSYQLTKKQNVKSKITRPIIAEHPKERFMVDFIIYKDLSHWNSGFKYLLVCIDIFSKFVAIHATKTRTTGDILNGYKYFIHTMGKPLIWNSDNEFNTPEIIKFLEEKDIRPIFSSPYNPKSQGYVERMNRTIKNMINLIFDNRNTKRYIDAIPDIVYNINNCKLKLLLNNTPQYVHYSMNKQLISRIYKRQYKEKKELIEKLNKDDELPELHIGDYVRINIFKIIKNKGVFLKKDKIRWSKLKYTVKEIYTTEWETHRYLLSNDKVYNRDEMLKVANDTIEDDDDDTIQEDDEDTIQGDDESTIEYDSDATIEGEDSDTIEGD